MAFTVLLVVMLIDDPVSYKLLVPPVAVGVGMLPSVVYQMEAPVVKVLMVRVWTALYVLAARLKTGIATKPTPEKSMSVNAIGPDEV